MSERASWSGIRAHWGLATGGAAFALLCGLLVAHGGILAAAVFAVTAIGVLAIPFSRLGHRTLWVWVAVMPLAYPFLRYPPRGTVVTFDRVWVAGMALVIVTTVARDERRSAAGRLMEASLGWLVVSFGIRAALTPASGVTEMRTWIDALCLPFALFVITRWVVSTQVRLRRLVGCLTVAGVAAAVIGIAEFAIGFQLATLSGGEPRFDIENNLVRISGPFPVPETFGLFLMCTVAATLVWLGLRRVPRWMAVALVVIQSVAIALTLFRAAWLGLAIVLIGGTVAGTTRRSRRLAVVGVAAALLYGAVVNLEQQSVVFQNRIQDTGNVLGRLATYRQGLEVFAAHPLFGVGVGADARTRCWRRRRSRSVGIPRCRSRTAATSTSSPSRESSASCRCWRSPSLSGG